ncbi:MAG TPA: potassium channel family protein [Streptosporangiaceae bacterium]
MSIRDSPIQRRSLRALAAALLIVALVMVDVSVHEGGTAGRAAASIWAGALLLTIVVLLLRQILAQPEVTVQSIYGAISAYLIIGLMFASFYAAMYFLHSKAFFAGHQPGSISNFQYFSFTTLTTLGYGDFTAGSSQGRAVAMLEAMTGQIFLATLVAKLVASFRPARASAREAADRPARPPG